MQNSEERYNRTIYIALRIGFIALLFIWSFEIIKPFILPILWGIIIAVAIFPIHEKLTKLLGGRKKISSTIITLFFLTLLIAPSAIFIDSTVNAAINISEKMQSGASLIKQPPSNVAEWRIIGKPIYDIWMLGANNMEGLIRKFAPTVLSMASGLTKTVLLFFISIIIGGVLLNQDRQAKNRPTQYLRLYWANKEKALYFCQLQL